MGSSLGSEIAELAIDPRLELAADPCSFRGIAGVIVFKDDRDSRALLPNDDLGVVSF